jgi:hypothetical protein
MLLYLFSAIRAVSGMYLVPMISSRGTHPPASPRNLDSTVVFVQSSAYTRVNIQGNTFMTEMRGACNEVQ